MIYRDLNPHDQQDLAMADDITGSNRSGDVRLSQDYITVAADNSGRFHAFAAGRPVVFVHEFILRESLRKRETAEGLLQFSLGKLSALGERQLHFLVHPDNTEFQKFIDDHGAWRQREGQIWTMNIPVSHYPKR